MFLGQNPKIKILGSVRSPDLTPIEFSNPQLIIYHLQRNCKRIHSDNALQPERDLQGENLNLGGNEAPSLHLFLSHFSGVSTIQTLAHM
jgi:hypothetical protein